MEDLKIEVLDSIMGSGKTQGIIQWMLDNPNYKYLYVSPLLTEVEDRIPTSCAGLEFVSPNTEEYRTKADHLLHLLDLGQNVSFTHSLFTSLTAKHLALIESQGYVLIVDEEIDFIEPYRGGDYRKEDILTLEKTGHIKVNEEKLGRVEWCWDEENFVEGSRYSKLKRMCDLEMLHCAKRDRRMMVLHLPIALLKATSRAIVLTYLFEGSVMCRFMGLKGVEVVPFTGVSLTSTEAEVKQRACDRIELFQTRTTRSLASRDRLSYSWYSEQASKQELAEVGKAIRSACRRGSRDEVLYTGPKDVFYGKESGNAIGRKPKIVVSGYVKEECFLYCGTKATNLYRHKTLMVHAYNRYPQTPVEAYLIDYGHPIDRDAFALSELVQWIWRSNIREVDSREKVQICLLSRRMERLFKRWLDYDDFNL